MPGRLSPALAELAVQFGLALPFAQAAHLLTAATGTPVSEATVRRLTERAGTAWCQLELALVAQLEMAALDPATPPVVIPDAVSLSPDSRLQISVDGAMVPLVGGEWAEVRTAAIGQVTQAAGDLRTTALSYVSHLTNAETFRRLVLAECTRREVADASAVVAVSDGAPWIQDLLDLQCPQAVRILDFAHAAEYLAQAAQAAFGPGTPETSEWFGAQRHELRHGDPERVLTALAALPTSAERDTAVGYLTARRPMLAYAAFTAAGWPIGSGCVESANKLVIEARLKGAGMHWTRPHADAMVALRAVAMPDRWDQVWPQIARALRAARPQRAARRRQRDRTLSTLPVAPSPASSSRPPAPPAPVAPIAARPVRPKLIVDGKPTTDHPWKRGLTQRSPSTPITKT